jgi:coenzyme F420-reducing hydrogenase gamma subunit
MQDTKEKTPHTTALKRIAFFSFTSCEGCQLVVLNYAERFPELLEHLKLVNFREVMDTRSDDYDIAFVEGSVSTRAELKKIKKIREKADIVISLGACAAIGGINCIKDIKEPIPLEKARELVYGNKATKHRLLKDTVPARPLNAVIKIDHYLHGCPISEEELLATLTDLMIGRSPTVPARPVCADCKMAGNVCVFEKGLTCNGPITRGGCRAICVSYGATCWGCRGYVDNPNIRAHTETLISHGLSQGEARSSLALYGSYGKAHKKTPTTENKDA